MATHVRSAVCAKRALFSASMLGGMLAAASALAAPALPTGGRVAAGSASIGSAGATLTVGQSSGKAIIDWSSFSIGHGGTVRFNNASGATLNRVTGTNVSSIDGLLSATGSVYLINRNGVIVGKSGVVDTGGTFVASTLDVGNASFLAGGPLTFSGPSVASVANLGHVGSLGGNVGLIAATVRNDGTITAPRGDVGLAAGTTVTLDDAANDGGGLFSVKVGDGSTSATNTGAIAAAAVELRAQQGNVYALAGATSGVIDATGIDASGGTIKLISEGGTTTVAGTLSAQGANGRGGQIETSGETLGLGAAKVDTHGGAWLLDPTNLIIDSTAASAIDTALASGDVTLATSASGAPTGPAGSTGHTATGNGDIIVASALTWSTASTLTFNAFNALDIDAPITVTGAGKAALNYGAGGLSFGLGPGGFAGPLSYAAGTGEGIAGQALTINGTGYTLLYSMTDVAGMGASGHFAVAGPITSSTTFTNAVVGTFSGTLEGLGNTITGLTINSTGDAGLIGTFNNGVVRDIGLVGGVVGGGVNVGALVAHMLAGAVEASYATSRVSGTNNVGGLVGGIFTGTVETSYATGAVSGLSATGGLVGANSGLVERSYATGLVSRGVGALGSDMVGGLVGWNVGGTVETSYATGAVTGTFDVGGLVGYNGVSSTLETSYATGAVKKVAGNSGIAGGLVGANDGAISNSYFDDQTTLNSLTAPGVGTGSATGVTGLTTAQLQSNAGGFMTNLGASFAGGTGGLFPYSASFFPNGAQAIVGTATSGGLPVAMGQVGLYSGGVLLGNGTVSTGANGYIYLAVAAGTLGASGDKIGAVLTLAGGSTPTGLVYTDAGALVSSVLTLPALAAGLNAQNTSGLTLSALNTGLSATFGGAYAGLQTALAAVPTSITAIGAGFTVNQTVSTAAGLAIETGAGDPLTIANAITVTGANTLALDAGGALDIDAPIYVTGAGGVTLTDGAGGPSFDLGPTGFAGSLSFAVGAGEGIAGQALTINGTGYTLLYSMADLAGVNGGAGHDALAATISATTSYTSAVVGRFSGALEGLGHSITGLTINDSGGNAVGLIGTLNGGGTVRDLGLTVGSVAGLSYVGALVGDNAGGTITDAIARGLDLRSIGGIGVGGLVGFNTGTVTGSSASNNVSNTAHGFGVGGLVGYNGVGAAITDSAASGAVHVGDNVRYTGGLAGYNDGTISNDSSNTTVNTSLSLYVGGIVGYNAAAGTIASSYASGADVTAIGGEVLGGVAGYNAGTIGDTYADLSVVEGGTYVGGLIGYNAGGVSTSWSSGEVAGTSASVGGAIGDQAGGTLTNDYWDEGTSGQSHATGLGGSTAGLTAIGDATGLDPHAQATYGGFNFTTTWTINPGTSRPYLRNPTPPTPAN